MLEEKSFNKYLLAIWLGIAHGFNDCLAGFLLGFCYKHYSIEQATLLYFLYVTIGFGGQVFAGLLIDRLKQTSYIILVVCFCWLSLSFYPLFNSYFFIGLIAFASSFIHVLGGSITVSLQQNSSKYVGVFIAPGVIGLTLGGFLAFADINLMGYFLTFSSLLLLSFLYFFNNKKTFLIVDNQRLKKIEVNSTVSVFKIKFIVILLLFSTFILRSFIWEIGQYVFQKNFEALALMAFFAFWGKLVGGFLSDHIEFSFFLLFSILFSILFLMLGQKHVFFFGLGLGFLQSSIPIGFSMMCRLIKNRTAFVSGLAFGLSILIGGLPFLIFENNYFLHYHFEMFVMGVLTLFFGAIVFSRKQILKVS